MAVAARDVARVLADVFAEPLDDLGSTSRGTEKLIASGITAVMALIEVDEIERRRRGPAVHSGAEPALALRQIGDVWYRTGDSPVKWTALGWHPIAPSKSAISPENQE